VSIVDRIIRDGVGLSRSRAAARDRIARYIGAGAVTVNAPVVWWCQADLDTGVESAPHRAAVLLT
jgi:hypothetical protein